MSERDRHLDDARCADLVLGLLATAERERALRHAERCTPCATRLRAHVSATFRARADQPGAVLAIPRPRAARGWVFGLAGGAAAVLVGVVLLMSRPASRPSAATHWLSTPSEGTLMRTGQPADPRLSAGFAAYARRDLAAAERDLEAAHASEGAEQARRLYLAHVLLLREDSRGALALLRSLDYTDLPATVSRDAVALLAQALRAEGSIGSADSLEHALRQTPEWVPVLP